MAITFVPPSGMPDSPDSPDACAAAFDAGITSKQALAAARASTVPADHYVAGCKAVVSAVKRDIKSRSEFGSMRPADRTRAILANVYGPDPVETHPANGNGATILAALREHAAS